MSNWVHLEITLNSSSKVSIRKVVDATWKGAQVKKDLTQQKGRDRFFVSYPDCGVQMLRSIEKILEDIKRFDNKSNPIIHITQCAIY